jgi:hypothetical protein
MTLFFFLLLQKIIKDLHGKKDFALESIIIE